MSQVGLFAGPAWTGGVGWGQREFFFAEPVAKGDRAAVIPATPAWYPHGVYRPRLLLYLLLLSLPADASWWQRLCGRLDRKAAIGGAASVSDGQIFASAPGANHGQTLRAIYQVNQSLGPLLSEGVLKHDYRSLSGPARRHVIHFEAPTEALYQEALTRLRVLGVIVAEGKEGPPTGTAVDFDSIRSGKAALVVIVTKGKNDGVREAAYAQRYFDEAERMRKTDALAVARPVPSNEAASALREELAANLTAAQGLAIPITRESLARPEPAFLDAAKAEKGHVMYFGSDTAVHDVLTDFPLASDYHLVDKWGAGGFFGFKSPGEKFVELKKIFGALGPGAQVEVVDRGFLGRLSAADLSSYKAFEARASTLPNPSPQVLQVTWSSPSQGPVTKRFHLHYTDYNSADHLERTMRALPPEGAAGILFQGGPMMELSNFDVIRRRLKPDGVFVGVGSHYIDGVDLLSQRKDVAVTRQGTDEETVFFVRPAAK